MRKAMYLRTLQCLTCALLLRRVAWGYRWTCGNKLKSVCIRWEFPIGISWVNSSSFIHWSSWIHRNHPKAWPVGHQTRTVPGLVGARRAPDTVGSWKCQLKKGFDEVLRFDCQVAQLESQSAVARSSCPLQQIWRFASASTWKTESENGCRNCRKGNRGFHK